jgi:hypothetical protein
MCLGERSRGDVWEMHGTRLSGGLRNARGYVSNESVFLEACMWNSVCPKFPAIAFENAVLWGERSEITAPTTEPFQSQMHKNDLLQCTREDVTIQKCVAYDKQRSSQYLVPQSDAGQERKEKQRNCLSP